MGGLYRRCDLCQFTVNGTVPEILTWALRDLGTRTGVADLKRLTESVLQAERMGISIAEAMRTLADESRIRRRQRAEEEAQKAPVKMVPVMVLTTLPAIGAGKECPQARLCRAFPVTKATISHHLKELVQAGLVEPAKGGANSASRPSRERTWRTLSCFHAR